MTAILLYVIGFIIGGILNYAVVKGSRLFHHGSRGRNIIMVRKQGFINGTSGGSGGVSRTEQINKDLPQGKTA